MRRLNIRASQCEIYLSDGVLNITVSVPLVLKYVACRLQHYHNYLRSADNAAGYIRGLKFFLPWGSAALDECYSRTIAPRSRAMERAVEYNRSALHVRYDAQWGGRGEGVGEGEGLF